MIMCSTICVCMFAWVVRACICVIVHMYMCVCVFVRVCVVRR